MHLRLVIGLVVVDLRRGLQAFGASLPSLPGVHGRQVANGRLGLPAVLVRAVASPVHLELKAAVASALAHDALHDVLFFRVGGAVTLGVAARRGGLVLLPPLSRHAIWLAVVLGAQLHLRHLRQRVAHTVIAARKRVHEGEAAAAVRHVARGDHLSRAQREHVRRVLRVVVAQIDARLRLGLQPAALLLRHVAVGVAAPHVDVPQTGLLAAHRLVRRHPRILRDVRAVPHERRVASRPAPQLWRRARVLDHGALVIFERAHGALGGPIQLLGACRRPAQLLPVLGAERLQRLVDELRAAVRVQALDRAAELRLRLANKDGDVVRDLVLAPQLGVPHVAGEHVLHHQAVLHDHAAIALHLHLVRVHVQALARLGAAVQAAVPKGCPRRLALDARRALTNARLCRLDAAAAHALQINAVVEHPAAVQHAHHARPAAMGHLLVQAHQRVRILVADRPGGPRVSEHHALRSGAHQHRHSAARAERHAVPSGRDDVRFLRGAVVLPAQLLGQKLAAQQVRREALVVQHVVDDDAHHLAAVRHHAERHAPDVAGMDDAAVRHLDRHRSALAQRDKSSAVAAAAGRRHAVPAPGIIGQCCVQRHCFRLGLRAGALGIGGHRHLLLRGNLRRDRGRCSSRHGRRHRQSRGRSRAGSHRTDSRSLEGLCPRGRRGGCSSALLSYRGSISGGRAPTATSRPFQQRSTLLVGLLALHDVRVGPGTRCAAARIRVDAARLARQRRAHALSALRQAIVVALLSAAVRPRTSRSVSPLTSMPAGTSTAGRSSPLAAASGVRGFGRVRANRCHVALLVAAEADALVLRASLVTGAAPATLVAIALCPASVAGGARLLGGAVAATHGRHQRSAVRPLGANALLVALVLVDEGRHLVPLDLVRLLQQIAQLECEHSRPVARLQPVEQHEGVLARRRLLLGVVQQRQDVIDARAVRVERLVVLLAQRHPLRQQLADVVLLGALQLRLEPVRQAVGEVLQHALSRL